MVVQEKKTKGEIRICVDFCSVEFIVENIDNRGRNPIDRPAASVVFTQEQKDKMCSFAEKRRARAEIWNKITLNILDIYRLKKNPYYP